MITCTQCNIGILDDPIKPFKPDLAKTALAESQGKSAVLLKHNNQNFCSMRCILLHAGEPELAERC